MSERLTNLLIELEDYFGERADADQPSGSVSLPNEELVLLDKIIRFRESNRKIVDHEVDEIQKQLDTLQADKKRLRGLLADVIDCFFDMSPLEYAASRKLTHMSDAVGEAVLQLAREELKC